MNTKYVCIILIALMLLPSASASILDDLNSDIGDMLRTFKSLSIPGIGTVEVSCDRGATCTYAGSYWHITTSTIAADQDILITLPKGKTWTDTTTNTVVTAGEYVDILIKPDHATITKPVQQMTATYRTCFYGTICGSPKSIPGYEPSGISAVKTVYYTVILKSANGNVVKNMVFDYMHQGKVELNDGTGTMTITPNYMIDTGYVIEPGTIVIMDDGYGTYRAYTYGSFILAHSATESDLDWNVGGLPQNWLEYINYMKRKGLIEAQDAGMPVISNQQATFTYPGGSVGVQGEILIPKAMALTVSAGMNLGKVELSPITISPDPWTIGQGSLTVSFFVKNAGETADNFRASIEQNIGTVTVIKDSAAINPGNSESFSFRINPTITSEQGMAITVWVTAAGSHDEKSVTKIVQAVNPPQDCGFFGCTTKTQKVSVTAYDDKKSVLSTAPIYKNGQQVGSGRWDGDLPYGKYVFSTDNTSNPRLYAPTPVTVVLSGGDMMIVPLYFSTVPPEQIIDLTWLFWLAVGLIVLYFAYRTGWLTVIASSPALMILVIALLFALWFVYHILLVMMGISQSIDAAYQDISNAIPRNW